MVITRKQLNRIKFPVYVLPNSNWSRSDGLLYLDDKLLDDTNMPGETLGVRRLQSPMKGFFPLKKKIDSFIGLLKQDTNTFIDSNGVPFIYEKTKMCSLKYHKIQKVDKKEVASVLWLKGVKAPFIIPRPPGPDMQYAGVLYLEKRIPWLLYEYSPIFKENTLRKV